MSGDRTNKYITILTWLAVIKGMILFMVAVGGITRLTNSGLSMVTWEPIMGVLPPMTEEAWQFRFDQYRAFPEYQQLNRGMSLGEFKQIYFWEYFHRLVGRLLGVVYAIPLAFFWMRGWLDRKLKLKLFIGLLLGGSQGVLGWYMVKSGLVDNPYVSHYRLAAHLGLAFIIILYLLWVFLSLFPFTVREGRASPRARGWAWSLCAVLAVQVVWGAFVAGLNAGYIYNTYPTMQGYWVPPGWDAIKPVAMNFFDNPVTVQLVHRTLAAVLVLLTAAGWVLMVLDRSVTGRKRRAIHLFAAGMLVQFGLGILTLILHVPVALGVMHQVMACVLMGIGLFMLYAFHGGNGLMERMEASGDA